MRTAVIDEFGPPDVLRMSEARVPEPGPGEVLISARSIGVNAIDWLTRAGTGVGVPAFPVVLGWDISGRVVGTGSGVTCLAIGDEAFGMLRFPAIGRAYAEYVVGPEKELTRKPPSVPHQQTAGAMVVLTAWQSLVTNARLERGQRLLVHGAAGGVGHVAVQLARHLGAEVIGTASERNRNYLLGLGAIEVADYATPRLSDVVGTVDAVLDTRGGDDFFRLLDVLRPGGVIVTLKGHTDAQDAALEQHGVRGTYTYVAPSGEILERIAPLLADGTVAINVHRAFALDEVAAAHALGEAGHVRGMLVLDVPE